MYSVSREQKLKVMVYNLLMNTESRGTNINADNLQSGMIDPHTLDNELGLRKRSKIKHK